MAGHEIVQLQAMRGQTPPDPTAAMAALPNVLLAYLAVIVIALPLNAVLNAAGARAILRPQESRFGYLRLGMDEVRLLLLALLILAVCIGAAIAAGIAVSIPMLAISVASKSVAMAVRALLAIAVCCGAVYCAVRLSLAFALSFDTRRVDLFGSWSLTRRRFWPIFGTYLLIVALALVVLILVAMINAAVAAVAGGGLAGVGQIFHPDISSLSAYFTPVRFVSLLVQVAAGALVLPLFLTAQAELYRQLNALESSSQP
jgi:hypothetical protein